MLATLINCVTQAAHSDLQEFGELACYRFEQLCQALTHDVNGKVDLPEWCLPLICRMLHDVASLSPDFEQSEGYARMRRALTGLAATATERTPWMQALLVIFEERDEQLVLQALHGMREAIAQLPGEHAVERAQAPLLIDALGMAFIPADMPDTRLEHLRLYVDAVAEQNERWVRAGEPPGELHQQLDSTIFMTLCDSESAKGAESLKCIDRFLEIGPNPRAALVEGLMAALRANFDEQYSEQAMQVWLRAGAHVARTPDPQERALLFWDHLLALDPTAVAGDVPGIGQALPLAMDFVAGLASDIDPALLAQHVRAHAVPPGSVHVGEWNRTDLDAIYAWTACMDAWVNAPASVRQARDLIDAMSVHAGAPIAADDRPG